LVRSQDFLSGEVEPQPVICLMDDEQWLDRAPVPALAFTGSHREAQEQASGKTPLPTVTVPAPSGTFPCHSALPFRAVI
jgi:hypothetical protein